MFVVENDVKVECDEMRNEMWVVDDERLIWAIEIVKLRIVEFDWIVELCELHVFDGNELVVLNGWLICGKPRKKEMMRLKAYAIWWDEKLGNVKLHQWMIWEKKMIDIEKDAQKGKMIDMKKRCPNGKRMWWDWWKWFT